MFWYMIVLIAYADDMDFPQPGSEIAEILRVVVPRGNLNILCWIQALSILNNLLGVVPFLAAKHQWSWSFLSLINHATEAGICIQTLY